MSGTTTHWAIPYATGTDSPPDVASAMQSLATVSDTAIFAVGNVRGISNNGGTGTTTSASYSNVPATSSFSFTKGLTATRLHVNLSIDTFCTAVGGGERIAIAVLVSGTDYVVAAHSYGAANQYELASGMVFISGLVAGVYTIQARWQRFNGAGTVSINSDGWLSMACAEVSA